MIAWIENISYTHTTLDGNGSLAVGFHNGHWEWNGYLHELRGNEPVIIRWWSGRASSAVAAMEEAEVWLRKQQEPRPDLDLTVVKPLTPVKSGQVGAGMSDDVKAGEQTLAEQIALAQGWRYDPDWRGIGTWISPDGKLYQSPPAYDQDLNLAWTLLAEFSMVSLLIGSKGIGAIIHGVNNSVGAFGQGASTYGRPAVAICLAYLAYQEALSARQGPAVQLDPSAQKD